MCFQVYSSWTNKHNLSHRPLQRQITKIILIQQFTLDCHHIITVWGTVNIYQVLVSPNGFLFTICQVFTSIRSIQNLISPLFFGVDQSPEGEVVVTCNQSMKEEAKTLLCHFGIYLKVRFESIVWEDFLDPYRTSMKAFQYCPLRKCVVERTAATDASMIVTDDFGNSFDCDFSNLGLTEDLWEVPHKIKFDMTYQVSLLVGTIICGILGNINGDSGTIRSNLSAAALVTFKSVLPTPINYLNSSQTPIPPSNNITITLAILS